MPRLSQVSRAEAGSLRILETYDKHFGDRDPVAEPGTHAGTPGNWWTVFALDPQLFGVMLDRQAWQFSEDRKLPPVLRELAVARAGWVGGSSFVYSQHSRLLRRLGVDEERIAAIPSWSSEEVWSPVERVVLGFADDLVAGGGRVSDRRFAALKDELPDVAILELAFIVTTYAQSATLARALRLEYDDVPDPVVDHNAVPANGTSRG